MHIHVKVHTDVTLTSDGSFTGGQELHTGQLFFDETVTARVGALSPYSANTVTRTTLAQDSIYDEGGAASGLLTLTALGSSPSAGYAGTLTLGVEQG